MIAGVIFASISHKQWVAESILQVGQIEYMNGPVGSTAPVLTESVAEIVERVKSPDIRKKLLEAQNEESSDESSPLARLLKKTLDATPIVNSSLIRLSVRGFSPEQAATLMQQTQDQLIELSRQDAAPVLNGFHQSLAAVNQALVANDAQLASINAVLQQRTPGSATNAGDTVALGILSKATTERQDLMLQKRTLELQLVRSFVSKPIQAPTVDVIAAYPRPLHFAAAGFVVGLFLGCVIGWFRYMRQTNRLA